MRADRFVPGDALPGAPEFAPRGPHGVGVTTLEFSNPNQVDVLASLRSGELRRGLRTLTAEVWYPSLAGGEERYCDHTLRQGPAGEPRIEAFEVPGWALRDAEPDRRHGPSPLVVVSHGYPGSRLLLSWLGENLASKGYAVMALDHTDSTVRDRGDVLSSLRNRPLDLALALRLASELERHHPLLQRVWDSAVAALVGFSMGGYGSLVALGAGFDPRVLAQPAFDAPLWRDLLRDLSLGDPFYEDLADSVRAKVRAAVLLAPWGGASAWSDAALARVQVPTLIAAGSADDIAEYPAIRRIFAGVAAERYLLTFEHARHNVGNNPAPEHLLSASAEDWWRYADPVWDTRRILSVLQHHISAFLGGELRGMPTHHYQTGACASATDWPGYPNRATVGLRMEALAAPTPPQV
jgi:predicted dienelactone hydrolase